MPIKQRTLTVRESTLDLRRRGYWDPKWFPTVATFAALPKTEQDHVVVTCKRVGFWSAVELIPKP